MLHSPCAPRIFWLLRSRGGPSLRAEDKPATPTWSPIHTPSLPRPFQCHLTAICRFHEDHLPSEWPGRQWRRQRQQEPRCESCLWWRCTRFGKWSSLEAMSLNRYKLSEASKHASRYKLQKGDVPKIATGVATMCVSPREKPQRFKFAKLEWTVEAPTTWPSKRGTFFSIAKIQLPGNSAIVTFLGWWVHVTRTQRPQKLIMPFN